MQHSRALVLVLATRIASAEVAPEEARRAAALFDQGRKEMVARKFDVACDAFSRSLALDPQSGTRLNLAACWIQQDRLEQAHSLLEAALAEAETASNASRVRYAREQLDTIEARLVRVQLVLTNPDGVTVRLQGAAVDPARRQLVRPGRVILDASAPGSTPFHVEKLAAAGAAITIEIPSLESSRTPTPEVPRVQEERPASPPRPVQRPELGISREPATSPPRRIAPILLAAGGGAMLITAGVLTLHARSRWVDAIDRADAAEVSSAQSEADIGTIVSIAGAVAISAGAVWWWRSGRHRTIVVAPAPNGLAIAGEL